MGTTMYIRVAWGSVLFLSRFFPHAIRGCRCSRLGPKAVEGFRVLLGLSTNLISIRTTSAAAVIHTA